MNEMLTSLFGDIRWAYITLAYTLSLVIVAITIIVPVIKRRKELAKIRRKIERGKQ